MLKISIITVCFNSEKTIRSAIESVLSQNYPNIEYIVVDGASTDSTMSIVSEYKGKIATVVSEPDLGIYDAMNKGIRLATGDVIGILNSDDFFENLSVISDVSESFMLNSSTGCVFGDVVFVDSIDTQKLTRFYSSRKFRSWKLRFGWMPPHTATFIKKSVFSEIGEYSLNYKIASDYELFVRMLMVRKISFSRLNKVLVRMRTGGISTSGLTSSYLLNLEIVRACKSNGIYTNMFFVLLKIPFKMLELMKRPSGSL